MGEELLVVNREETKAERQKILDRLNSYDDGLNEEAQQREKELERKRRSEREKEIERGRGTAGF